MDDIDRETTVHTINNHHVKGSHLKDSSDEWVILERDGDKSYQEYNTVYRKYILACTTGDLYNLPKIESEFVKFDRFLERTCIIDAFHQSALEDVVSSCIYLYANYNLSTGMRRSALNITSIFHVVKRIVSGSTPFEPEIDPGLFIACCKKNCYKVVEWMLGLNTLSHRDLCDGFNIAMIVGCSNTCSILYNGSSIKNSSESQFIVDVLQKVVENGTITSLEWFYKQDMYRFYMFTPHIFLLLCKYGNTDGLRWLLDIRRGETMMKNVLHKDILYKGLFHACVTNHVTVLQLLEAIYTEEFIKGIVLEYDAESTNRLCDVLISNKMYESIKWLCKIKHYRIVVTGITDIGIEVFVTESTKFTIEHAVNDVLEKLPNYVFGCTLKHNNTQKGIFNSTTFHNIVKKVTSSKDVIHVKRKKFLDDLITEISVGCNANVGDGETVVTTLGVSIDQINYVRSDKIFQLLCKTYDTTEREILAEILINLNNLSTDDSIVVSSKSNNLYYRYLMITILNLDTDQTDVNSSVVYESECPICLCDYDLVLNCGHVVCMACAYNWYIKEENEQRCLVCREKIELVRSRCTL